MEKGKKAKNAKIPKKKSFFRKNFSIIILILLSGMSIAINYYDKENSEMINVEVDKNLEVIRAEFPIPPKFPERIDEF